MSLGNGGSLGQAEGAVAWVSAVAAVMALAGIILLRRNAVRDVPGRDASYACDNRPGVMDFRGHVADAIAVTMTELDGAATWPQSEPVRAQPAHPRTAAPRACSVSGRPPISQWNLPRSPTRWRLPRMASGAAPEAAST